MLIIFSLCARCISAAVPSKPGDVLCEKKTKDYIILCWYPPSNDGGKPITAYVADIREIGSEIWTQYVSPLNTSTLDANLSFFFLFGIWSVGQYTNSALENCMGL